MGVKKTMQFSSDKKETSSTLHLILIGAIVISLILSITALVKVNNLEQSSAPQQGGEISIGDFLQKLTSHNETAGLVGVSPLNIVQITQQNLGNLQSQIGGLDISYLGNYLVQYQNVIILYDYQNDAIRGVLDLQKAAQQAQLANDFVTKLYAHPELKGVEKEQPTGGQIDEATLSTLQQQFPDVYKDAKVGDFLLRYSDRLVIYDYQADKVVNAVALSTTPTN